MRTLSRVWFVLDGEVPDNPWAGTACGGTRGAAQDPPPPTPRRSLYISGLLTSVIAQFGMYLGGVTGEGFDLDRPSDPLRSPPRARHNIGPEGGNPPPLSVPIV